MSGSVESDTTELMLYLEKIKRMDMRVAVDIAGLANMPVRDGNGNLLPSVWTRQSVSNEYENATLLTRDALARQLQTFIDAGVQANLEILHKVEDPAKFVDWVVRTAEYWEKRYALKRPEKFDISQTVYSAMYEVLALERVWEVVKECGLLPVFDKLQEKIRNLNKDKNKFLTQLLEYVTDQPAESTQAELESFFWVHRGFAAFVRFLFRVDVNQNLRENVCTLAAKMLQKKEVCNKAGTYASRTQRQDVQNELSNQLQWFEEFLYRSVSRFSSGSSTPSASTGHLCQMLLRELEQDKWIFLIIDHTALPITLSHLRTPPVRTQDAHVTTCPHCHSMVSAVSLEHKRRRHRLSTE